jgi:hypothetical protein
MNKTSKQVLEEHVQVLGPNLGPLYNALYEVVDRVQIKMKQYKILFDKSS